VKLASTRIPSSRSMETGEGEGRMHAPIYYLIIKTLLASQLILGNQCVNVKGMVSLAQSFAVS